jgi:hypothetical protein
VVPFQAATGGKKRRLMKICRIQTLFVPVLVTGLVALTLSLGPATVSASSERNGRLHVIKECSEYTGLPGSFCTKVWTHLRTVLREPGVRFPGATHPEAIAGGYLADGRDLVGECPVPEQKRPTPSRNQYHCLRGVKLGSKRVESAAATQSAFWCMARIFPDKQSLPGAPH